MEIAIIGCSHSLNTGVNLYQTVTDINDGKFDETANNGYGAILAKMFPQHNFTLFPAVGGGNKEILELLTFAIEQKKYEMYIVQTTSWHRFVAGLLYYNKKYFNISKNISAYLYDTSSYKNQILNNGSFFPNFFYSFLPCQPIELNFKGTGTGRFFNFEKDLDTEFTYKTFFANIIVNDYFASKHFLDENFMVFNILNMLSEQYNIWYFHWDPPVGRKSDFEYVFPDDKKQKLQEYHSVLCNRWKNKNHKKQIKETCIDSHFRKKFGEKKYVVDFIKDSGTHLSNDGHNIVVDFLLENNKFKKELSK